MMKKSDAIKRALEFEEASLVQELFGPGDINLTTIGEKTGTIITARGNKLFITGQDKASVNQAAGSLIQLYEHIKAGNPLLSQDVEHSLAILAKDPGAQIKNIFQTEVQALTPNLHVKPRSENQRNYMQAIKEHDLCFGLGPAGTGKTYLAVAQAVAALSAGKVKRIVLTRPAVEAGENLGFLPGDLAEKVNPYLRPLYDALHDMLGFGRVEEMMETGIIEVAPLAFMRGRTLNDAFIILDEAQNTTKEQMKMFLTRLGFGAKAVVTGDITQIDLPGKHSSGLIHATQCLKDIAAIKFITFTEIDVIRHPLVGKIVKAYEQYEKYISPQDE